MNEKRTDATSRGVPVTRLQPAVYDFRLDDDLTKYVTVDQVGGLVTIRVRFAADVVLHDYTRRLRTSGAVKIGTDKDGVTISYQTAYLFGLVRWRRSARF